MTTLDSLVVPAAFARHDQLTDTAILTDLYTWKSNTKLVLDRLDPINTSALSISELADLVRVLAPLTAGAPWSTPATRSLASVRLSDIPPSGQLIAHILTHIVKPLFAPTPHPRLHASTARVLPRPADVQDTYVEQPWKEHPGLDEVIRWCLLNTESSAYDTAWPLFLPPVMSFLDDYQVPYKLLGARLVSDLLNRVPSDLLLKTGVDALMFTSLTNSLSHLGDKSTPDFIQSAVTTTLQLIDHTTPSLFPLHDNLLRVDELQDVPATSLTQTLLPSQSKSLSTRFSRLSALLSSSLLGTVIMYTPTFLPPESTPALDSDPFADPEHSDNNPVIVPESPLLSAHQKLSFNPTLVAAAQILPCVLAALGIGGARFLKGVVPVLADWLNLPLPVVTTETGDITDGRALSHAERSTKAFTVDVALHLASLSSLSVLFHTCTPRIGRWSTTIISAIGQCWVGCLDIESQRKDNIFLDSIVILKKQLKEIAIQLVEVCPVVTKEYDILLTSHDLLFRDLVERIN